MVAYVRTDLDFILQQIIEAEQNIAPATPLLSSGLRTVDGSFNNLVPGQSAFGAADTTFPRVTTPALRNAESAPAGFGPPGSTSYQQTSGLVFDSQPRVISNLIVDMTANNPAAVAAAAANPGSATVVSPGLDRMFGTEDDVDVYFIPNASPDEGLSSPFNAWMTFFGQFFDHGLDLLTKGGSGTVFIPLKPDDPLYNPTSSTNFMVLTRATNQPGPDGVLGTADDVHEHENTTSPFVDQNQTYTSHPSHQAFLREYTFDAAGDPVDTGRLIVNRNVGPDGIFGNGDDTIIGGMATWKVVKAQARDLLGIDLIDTDVLDLPLLATDAYGHFIRGANGFPQVVMKGPDNLPGTTDDVLVEGNPAAPISLLGAVRTGHAFLNDIAQSATPPSSVVVESTGVVGGTPLTPAYDRDLLDAHYIAGDGRVNENIGLTTVHAVFHAEHNRLVEHTKTVVLESNDLSFLSQWLAPGTAPAVFPTTPDAVAGLRWNGDRLFQAAKFGTEMQYQHLVFEEFARRVQPEIDAFVSYDATIDPAIVAEFAHTVYRFGHSMLTETIDRLDANFVSSEIGLIAAFLNPLAFAASGPTPEQAAGAIVRGVTRQVANEIDEFATEALRNNLLGLPLDLPTINLVRGRDAGVPSLNAARREFHAGTDDSKLKPYNSWADLVEQLKHPESLINFIAAYGTHSTITAATTLVDKRVAASDIALGGGNAPDDRLDFLNSTGAWASRADGVTTTGVDDIDLWVGGLAEKPTTPDGLLGSTFNFVFETQLERLQDGDRFYYLERTAGLNFISELENNSFAKMIMANTDAKHLPGDVFSTITYTLEVDQKRQYNAELGSADPMSAMLEPLVIRDDPKTPGVDTSYLHYAGDRHVVLGGTDSDNKIVSGAGDDTIYGDAGDDNIDAGDGNDIVEAGAGDDVISDSGGDDVLHGGDGNDIIQDEDGLNLIFGEGGSDLIITGEDIPEVFAGQGNDFIYAAMADDQIMGNDGDDWIEAGSSDGASGDNFDPSSRDASIGNDVFIGAGEPDRFVGEGGDDIMNGGGSETDHYEGGSGFDWAIFKGEPIGVSIDMKLSVVDPASDAVVGRFAQIEGLSGSAQDDVLRGDDADVTAIAAAGYTGSVLTNIGLIDGLQALLGPGVTQFLSGNIILAGDGNDIIEGRGGNDLIDGDASLNVRISVRDVNNPAIEILTADSMSDLIPAMLAGSYSPGQLRIVREILYANGSDDTDTAAFAGARANYTVAVAADGTAVVTDNVGNDGTDTIRHVEQLRFADQTMVIKNNGYVVPESKLALPARGLHDANNVSPVTLSAGLAVGNTLAFANGAAGSATTTNNEMVGRIGNDTLAVGDADPAGGQDLLDMSSLGITAEQSASAITVSGGVGHTLIGIGADTITLAGVNVADITQTDFRFGS